MERIAPIGIVMIHPEKIWPTFPQDKLFDELTKPTPMTAPISVCVVETGKPQPELKITTNAVAKFAAKADEGVIFVIPLPTVPITL